LVYTVTVIRYGSSADWDWQLLGYCISLKFSGPEALKIPAVRGCRPRGLGPDSAGFLASGRPPKRGGLSVSETLHLVSDIPTGYQMF
jgi:hypothetical protein